MRLSSPARFAPLLFLFVLAAGIAGCENKHIGRKCDLNTPDAGEGLTSTINDQALECPTRICIQPAAETPTDTQAYCTAYCESDDDCEGEGRGGATDDKRCKTGFACGVATTVGNFCCRRMCICRDFVNAANGFPTPPSCMPGQSSCVNVR